MFWRKPAKRQDAAAAPGPQAIHSTVSEDAAQTMVNEREFVHWLDRIYEDFEQNGGIKHNPGYGKPLKVVSDDPLQSMMKNAHVLPQWLELQHEIREAIASLLRELEHDPNAGIDHKIDEINNNILRYNKMVPAYPLQKPKISRQELQRHYMKWI